MSQNYNAKRTRNIFDPKSSEPFRLSRSKIDMFLNCPRCFYLDRRLGIGQPQGPAFTLNVAVDALLKKEFNIHRAKGEAHPLMKEYCIAAVPFDDPRMDKWRENFVGVEYLHEPTNFLVFGAVDDIWINNRKELHVVDYKATSKEGEVELTDSKWHNQYRRQMEIYQWLLRRNELKVSDVGYFVYVNGKKDRAAFDGKLEFDVDILTYKGSDKWVEKTIIAAHKCLSDEKIPEPAVDCDYCNYRRAARGAEKDKF